MNKNFIVLLVTFIVSFTTYGQKQNEKTITISGKVIEKGTNLPLEYATIVFENISNKQLSGGITDAKGNFKFEIPSGNYNAKVEFISFKSVVIAQKEFTSDTNLGTFSLVGDVEQLDEIQVIAEKSTVEIKLDKRVYNVGKDMMVKGGTVSDVLDNVPSVTVDAEGNVALRGNENVKILIDDSTGLNHPNLIKTRPFGLSINERKNNEY